MDLRHLRYFLAVADEGGFVRAAERLRLAQPALSRQIQDLERELNERLIVRDRRSFRLTPAGESVAVTARAITEEITQALERTRSASRGLAGQCSICAGLVPTWNGLIAGLMSAVARDCPMVELGVIEGTGPTQWLAIRSGEADLGIGVEASREFTDLESRVLVVNYCDAAVLASRHPLAGRASIRLSELATETIVSPVGLEGDHRRVCEQIAARVTPPAPIQTTEGVADAFAVIAAGKAWTPFIRALAAWVPPENVVVPVEDLAAPIAMHVISKRGRLPGVVRTVRDALLTIAREPAHTASPGAIRSVIPAGQQGQPYELASDMTALRALELRHLRYFLAVVEERSVGRAARRLAITQPTLSRQMHDLERMFGVQLLERQPTGVVPTAAGETFAADAQRILDRVTGVAADAHRATRGATGHCIVAVIPAFVTGHLVGALVRAAASELPDAHVRFVEMPTTDQPNALVSGEADVGLCYAFTSVTPFLAQLERHQLIDDPICCVLLPPEHRLAMRDEIALADLGEFPFLFVPRWVYPAFYDRTMLLFAAQEFYPRIEREYQGLQTMWSVARRGEGWCLGFRTHLRLPPAGLAAVRVRGLDLTWGIEMLTRQGESSSVVVHVMELIRRAAARSDHAFGEPPENAEPSGIGPRPQ